MVDGLVTLVDAVNLTGVSFLGLEAEGTWRGGGVAFQWHQTDYSQLCLHLHEVWPIRKPYNTCLTSCQLHPGRHFGYKPSDLDGHLCYKFYELLGHKGECVTLGLGKGGAFFDKKSRHEISVVHHMLPKSLLFVCWTPFVIRNMSP